MTDAYTIWNKNLAAYFFNENIAGREVLLYANFDLIKEAGANLGGIEGFVDAVKTGPTRIPDGNICVKAYRLFQAWEFDRSGDYPPYIAYLVSFVLANYIEGNFDANAYYPRLKTLLKLDHESKVSYQFNRMDELWQDLEKWSKEDREGEMGIFTARVRGGNWHIGLPLSQTILSKKERDCLPLIFSESYFEPGANLPAATIADALRTSGQEYFSKKTMRLLNSTQDKELKAALIDFVGEELSAWNGFSPKVIENKVSAVEELTGSTRSSIKTCLQINPFSKKATALLRIKSNTDFPVEGLKFSAINFQQQTATLECKRASKFWSTPLKKIEQNSVNSFVFDWTKQLLLRDEERNWTAVMNGANIKFFTRGKNEQLPDDWIESLQVPEINSEFALACHPDMLETASEWVEEQCEFLKQEIKLPNEWAFFQIKKARAPFPGTKVTNSEDRAAIRLRGGARLGNRNAFINYCPPRVLIENAPENISVNITGNGIYPSIALIKEPDANIWSFPKGIPAGQLLKIQVSAAGEEITVKGNKTITFEEGNLLSSKIASVTSNVARDHTGRLVKLDEEEKPLVNGAKTYNYHPRDLEGKFFPPFAGERKIIILGRKVGEIIEFKPDLPVNFNPVWALVKCDRKRWLVQFCALGLKNVAPLSQPSGISGKKVKEWKYFIWNNRMLNDSSQLEFTSIKKLWEAYKSASAGL